jgi:hypothetical protein
VTTSSPPERSAACFFALGSSSLPSATSASARVAVASPGRGPNTTSRSLSSENSESVLPRPIVS